MLHPLEPASALPEYVRRRLGAESLRGMYGYVRKTLPFGTYYEIHIHNGAIITVKI